MRRIIAPDREPSPGGDDTRRAAAGALLYNTACPTTPDDAGPTVKDPRTGTCAFSQLVFTTVFKGRGDPTVSTVVTGPGVRCECSS